MSKSTHPTQQQLDELEALMQRMLALPVNQLDDNPGPVAAEPSLPDSPDWESIPEPSALFSATMPEEPPADEPEGVVMTERVEEPPPIPKTEEPEHPPIPSIPVMEPMVPVLRTPIIVRPPEEPAEIQRPIITPTWKPAEPEKPPVRPVSTFKRPPVVASNRFPTPALPRRRERPRWWVRSLVWSNRKFDRYAGRMGGPGRWLRGPYGRAVLGLTGLLLLMAALVLGAIDWIGWTW